MVASAAAIETGLPPKVEACEPGTQSMISARRHADAQRHAAGNALGHADHVRLHAGVLDGPPLARAARAALHLVHHQQNAVAVADGAQLAQKVVRRHHVAAFALDRLDEDRRHFFRRQNGLEQLLFDVARAAQAEGFFSPAGRPCSRDRHRDSECASRRAPAAKSGASAAASSRSATARPWCAREMRRRTRSSAGVRCDSAPASARTQSPRRRSCHRRNGAAPAWARPPKAAPPDRSAARCKNRCPKCESAPRPASEWRPPLQDGNGRSRPRRCPRQNRETRCRPRLPRECRGRAWPPADTSAYSWARSAVRRPRPRPWPWARQADRRVSVRIARAILVLVISIVSSADSVDAAVALHIDSMNGARPRIPLNGIVQFCATR